MIYAFLDYVLSDNRNREKLKELTAIHLKDRGMDIEETENPDDKNDSLDNQKVENLDKVSDKCEQIISFYVQKAIIRQLMICLKMQPIMNN